MTKKFIQPKVVFPVTQKTPIAKKPNRVIKLKNRSVPLKPTLGAIVEKRKRVGLRG